MSDPNVTGALSRNPTTGQVIEHFRFQTDREIEQLLAEASAAYRAWRATPMTARVKMGLSERGSNMGVRCHKSDDLGGGSLAEPQKAA
jgi:hypothetical protein